ncbi:diguanylate phosphodiesterase [Desulfurobacterium thermolithotrophum DSM 11699]|uniref:Diguanylate phosphodiesterase n=1 Tax=Desulfurobacterium thermolithotrophum (strain DSM 11699 / BSA) TaxID=868864 RepID=F0S288_DESTD|nr:EAL domain-containing protein [Desulfurobacterium thermolithotrophum]ADY74103.1 diguanylate phosphodiesterase [Desulfurobacterium thermolithotrophum DSM 11699]
MEEYLKFFDKFCISDLEELPESIRKKQEITNVKDFCKEIKPQFKELISCYFKNKKRFEKLSIDLGRKLYEKGISIALIVDAVNTILFKIINYINPEHLPKNLIEQANQLMEEFMNFIALGFILELLPEKKKKLEQTFNTTPCRDLVNQFSYIEKVFGEGKPLFKEANDCPVTDYMKDLGFRIACNKLKICEEIEKTHHLLHTYFKLFKVYYDKKRYLPIYLILITIYFLFEKLGEMFRSVESAKKNISIEELISFILTEKKDIILFVLDPKEISFLNKVFGYTIGDKVFFFLMEKLIALIPPGKEQAIIKCIQGAICVISENNSIDYDKIFLEIKKFLKEEFKHLPIKLDVSGFLLKFPKEVDISQGKVLSSIKFAIRESKKNPENLFVLDLKKLDNYRKITIFKNFYEDLVEKISSGKIGLVIQGIYNLKTQKVSHYEVFVRLRDSKGEVIPAYEFIDLIYEYRLIDLLDIAVLRKIIENAHLFYNKFIFINISPRTFKIVSSSEEVKKLTKQMKKMGLKFGFEITEQSTIEDFDIIVDFFKKTKLPILIDDFGTGYSSFSHFVDFIERVPIKFLKIDGSYVKKIVDSGKAEKIVKTVNGMAHSLNIETVAEFAENKEIVDKLKKLEVDYGQGYFFEKPKLIV